MAEPKGGGPFIIMKREYFFDPVTIFFTVSEPEILNCLKARVLLDFQGQTFSHPRILNGTMDITNKHLWVYWLLKDLA